MDATVVVIDIDFRLLKINLTVISLELVRCRLGPSILAQWIRKTAAIFFGKLTERIRMNRRTFLSTASATAASGALLGFHRRSEAQSSTVTPDICNAACATHAQTFGAFAAGTVLPSNWANIAQTMSVLQSNWNNQNVDATLMSSYQEVSSATITSGNIPVQPILTAVQQYEPSTTADQIQGQLESIYSLPASRIQGIVSYVQENGLSYYIGQAARVATVLAGQASSSPTQPVPALFHPRRGGFHQAGYVTQGHYNCADDGAIVFALGTAFAVIAVMSAGTAPVIVGAAWAGISLWGGTAAATWGAAHVVACGF